MRLDRTQSTAKRTAFFSFAIVCLVAGGCGVGPVYHRPAVPSAPAYKEVDTAAWKTAEPKDNFVRGKWWEVFQDPQSNALEERIDAGNQNIAAAAANYAAARAIVRQTRSQYFPTLTTTPSINNTRIASTPYSLAERALTYTEYSFPLTASWGPDLWARVRNSVKASQYNAQASAADLENVRLLAHADLAADYFQLRGVEAQKQILDATLVAWKKYYLAQPLLVGRTSRSRNAVRRRTSEGNRPSIPGSV